MSVREIEKVMRVSGQPLDIPSGCSIAWDVSTSPPRIWYQTAAGVMTEWTGAAAGVENPMIAALAAGGYKITDLATGTAGTDAVNLDQMNTAISAAIGGAGITQAAWASVSNTAGFTGTVKVALQSTNKVVFYGNLSFSTWGTLANCCIVPLAYRPPTGVRLITVNISDAAYTTAYPMTLQIDTSGNVRNLSGSVISGASYVYFEGASYQLDQP